MKKILHSLIRYIAIKWVSKEGQRHENFGQFNYTKTEFDCKCTAISNCIKQTFISPISKQFPLTIQSVIWEKDLT